MQIAAAEDVIFNGVPYGILHAKRLNSWRSKKQPRGITTTTAMMMEKLILLGLLFVFACGIMTNGHVRIE